MSDFRPDIETVRDWIATIRGGGSLSGTAWTPEEPNPWRFSDSVQMAICRHVNGIGADTDDKFGVDAMALALAAEKAADAES